MKEVNMILALQERLKNRRGDDKSFFDSIYKDHPDPYGAERAKNIYDAGFDAASSIFWEVISRMVSNDEK